MTKRKPKVKPRKAKSPASLAVEPAPVSELREQKEAPHVCPEVDVAEVRGEAFAAVLSLITQRQAALEQEKGWWSRMPSRIAECAEIRRLVIALLTNERES